MSAITTRHGTPIDYKDWGKRQPVVKIDVPALIVHGDDDPIVPIADSALLSAKIVNNSKLMMVGAPHGTCTTHKHLVSEELISFING